MMINEFNTLNMAEAQQEDVICVMASQKKASRVVVIRKKTPFGLPRLKKAARRVVIRKKVACAKVSQEEAVCAEVTQEEAVCAVCVPAEPVVPRLTCLGSSACNCDNPGGPEPCLPAKKDWRYRISQYNGPRYGDMLQRPGRGRVNGEKAWPWTSANGMCAPCVVCLAKSNGKDVVAASRMGHVLNKSMAYTYKGRTKGSPNDGMMPTCQECEDEIGANPLAEAFEKDNDGYLTPSGKEQHEWCIDYHNEMMRNIKRAHPSIRGEVGEKYWKIVRDMYY